MTLYIKFPPMRVIRCEERRAVVEQHKDEAPVLGPRIWWLTVADPEGVQFTYFYHDTEREGPLNDIEKPQPGQHVQITMEIA